MSTTDKFGNMLDEELLACIPAAGGNVNTVVVTASNSEPNGDGLTEKLYACIDKTAGLLRLTY